MFLEELGHQELRRSNILTHLALTGLPNGIVYMVAKGRLYSVSVWHWESVEGFIETIEGAAEKFGILDYFEMEDYYENPDYRHIYYN